MKHFTVYLNKPNGDETFFTCLAVSKIAVRKLANKEYPKHKVTHIFSRNKD